MTRAVLATYARTPFHFARKGALANVRPDDLAAAAIKAVVERSGIDPATLDDVLLGCAYPEAAQGNNIARLASLLAGLPIEVPGMTVNRFCGSSMSAIHIAAGQIALGAGEAFLVGGVESMTMVPQGGFNFSPNPKFKGVSPGQAEVDIEACSRAPRGLRGGRDRDHGRARPRDRRGGDGNGTVHLFEAGRMT